MIFIFFLKTDSFGHSNWRKRKTRKVRGGLQFLNIINNNYYSYLGAAFQDISWQED